MRLLAKGLSFYLLVISLFSVSIVKAEQEQKGELDNLLKRSDMKDFAPIKIKRKALDLSDPFQVQIYGELRERGIKDKEILDAYDLLFENKFEAAYKNLIKFSSKDYVRSSLIYLAYKIDLSQTMIDMWIEELKNPGFLDKQTTVALDQVVGVKASNWLLKKGVFLTTEQIKILRESGAKNINFNDSLRAVSYLRTAQDATEAIGYLEVDDPLRLSLAESLVLSFARKGELANAAKVLKGVYEPGLAKSDDIEEVSYYYLNLARLLYQAKAYDASQEYYALIPSVSRHYLTAQVETLWISLQKREFERVKGQAKTLEHKIFKKHFLPDRHLISSIAHLQTCQFDQVNNSFIEFLDENRAHALKIQTELKQPTPHLIDQHHRTVKLLLTAEKTLRSEINKYGELNLVTADLERKFSQVREAQAAEARRQWQNRKRVMEIAIQKMRFVKIEYLSTMRRLKSKLALIRDKMADQVSTKASAPSVSNAVVFPFDGQFFSDELFSLTAQIKDLCLKEKKNVE